MSYPIADHTESAGIPKWDYVFKIKLVACTDADRYTIQGQKLVVLFTYRKMSWLVRAIKPTIFIVIKIKL